MIKPWRHIASARFTFWAKVRTTHFTQLAFIFRKHMLTSKTLPFSNSLTFHHKLPKLQDEGTIAMTWTKMVACLLCSYSFCPNRPPILAFIHADLVTSHHHDHGRTRKRAMGGFFAISSNIRQEKLMPHRKS